MGDAAETVSGTPHVLTFLPRIRALPAVPCVSAAPRGIPWVPETRFGVSEWGVGRISGCSSHACIGCFDIFWDWWCCVAAGDAENEVEILLLRHGLAVLRRQVARPSCRPADRVFLAALARMLPRDRWGSVFVRPETVRRWHRLLIARRWMYPRRPPGRPATDAGVRALVVRLAREIRVGATGGSRVSSPDSASGSRPAPSGRSSSRPASTLRRGGRRRRGASSCELRPAESSLATSSLSTPCCSAACRCSCSSNSRNIVETFVERTEPIRFLIHDRDSKFTAAFDEVFRTEGIRAIKTPVRAPNANAFTERWIGSARRECLDRLLIMN